MFYGFVITEAGNNLLAKMVAGENHYKGGHGQGHGGERGGRPEADRPH